MAKGRGEVCPFRRTAPAWKTNEVKHILIDGYSADLYLDPDPGKENVLIWMNDEAGALFTISASFSGDEIIKMAESVEVLESVDTAEMTS